MPVLRILPIILLAFFGFAAVIQPGQRDDDTIALVKANFLYHFASSDEWPQGARKGRFVIGIYGNHSLFVEFSAKYGSKPVGSQVIEVVELKSVDDSRFMHILYLDRTKRQEMANVTQQLRGKSTMLVTHFEGALAQGAVVNFKELGNTIRYELNRKAAEERGISLGTKIIQWAIQ
jgi:hypothetical protein